MARAAARCFDSLRICSSVRSSSCWIAPSEPTWYCIRCWRCLATAGESRRPRLDLEPRVLEVEVALDPVHDVLVDRALVAQRHHGGPLGLERLTTDALVLLRARLVVLAVGPAVEPGAEAPRPVLVQGPHPLDRVVERPLLERELVEPRDRRLCRLGARLRLLARRVVRRQVEAPDQRRQRQ